jgi:hypothetical protein
MKYSNVLLFSMIFICCIQNVDIKRDKVNKEDNIFEFEDIYSNQQKNGVELGPWWIFYKINIHNKTDSILSIYPKTDSVSLEALEYLQTQRKFGEEAFSKYVFTTPSIGDVFLLFKNDTISLYCEHSPIVLSEDSCKKYRFYTNSREIKNLYHNFYIREYKKFQDFLSDIVKCSTFAVILNKKDTCYLFPDTELNFYGDPLELGEWSFY